MKNSKKFQIIKILLSALAMIVVMVIIFNFSEQDATTSSNVSDSVADTVLDVLDKPVPPGQSPSSVPIVAGFNIRKLAHIFLYMCLGLTSFLFFASLFGLKENKFKLSPLLISLSALLFSFTYACLDEFHQSFVNGRAATLYDLGVDAIGFTSLISLSCAVYLLVNRIVNKKSSGKTV